MHQDSIEGGRSKSTALTQHEELRDFIKTLKSEKDKLQKEITRLSDINLKLETKLSDATIIAETSQNQLLRERAHREELQKIMA